MSPFLSLPVSFPLCLFSCPEWSQSICCECSNAVLQVLCSVCVCAHVALCGKMAVLVFCSPLHRVSKRIMADRRHTPSKLGMVKLLLENCINLLKDTDPSSQVRVCYGLLLLSLRLLQCFYSCTHLLSLVDCFIVLPAGRPRSELLPLLLLFFLTMLLSLQLRQ